MTMAEDPTTQFICGTGGDRCTGYFLIYMGINSTSALVPQLIAVKPTERQAGGCVSDTTTRSPSCAKQRNIKEDKE
jgi:hypothetical protein